MTKASLSVRIDLPAGGRLGPGKAALLAAIRAQGSIAAAARAMEMSYPRALRLVDDMNTQFKAPVIEKYHGGKSRGGATLTETGEAVLTAYQALAKKAAAATAAERKRFSALTKRG